MRLSWCLLHRYTALESPGNIDTAVELRKAAVAEGTGDRRVLAMDHLNGALSDRYNLFGDVNDLNAAIENFETSLLLMRADHEGRAGVQYDLADHFFKRYTKLHVRSDLDEAIRYTELTLEQPRRDNITDPESVVDTLVMYLQHRYDKFKDQEDLFQSVKLACQALNMAPEGHPKRRARSFRLSSQWLKVAIRSRNDILLQYGIDCAILALECPGDDPNHEKIVFLMSSLWMTRYNSLEQVPDLQVAIKCAEALAQGEGTALQRSSKLRYLASLLRIRFARLADPGDAEAAVKHSDIAIQIVQTALLDVSRNTPERIPLLTCLGDLFFARSQVLGAPLSDIHQAIQYRKKSLAESVERQEPLMEIQLDLSSCLYDRFRRLGHLDDLEKAIQHAEEALATPPVDSDERQHCATALHLLSISLLERYTRLGALSDPQAAVRHAEASLAKTEAYSTARGIRLQNLSVLMTFRYHKLRVKDDLSAIIKCTEEALAETSVHSFNYRRILRVLAFNLRYRYDAHGDVDDINAAVTHARRALTFCPVGDMDYRPLACDLGNILRTRYPASGNLSDLDEAIELGQEAIRGLPTDHFDRYNMFSLAGDAYLERYNATRSDEDHTLSLSHSLEAPLNRVLRAREIVAKFQSMQTWVESSTVLESALLLIPKISLPFLGREDLQHLLSKLNGLPSDAAAYALQAGKEASHALQLLELGRGVIASFGMDARSELTELEGTHSELFHSFTALRAVINRGHEESLNMVDDGIC